MDKHYRHIDEVIAAYESGHMTREDVAAWLHRHHAQATASRDPLAKPSGIVLQTLAATDFDKMAAPVASRPRISLRPLAGETSAVRASGSATQQDDIRIDILDHGDGVFSLDVVHLRPLRWSTGLIDRIRSAIARIASLAEARVVLLRGGQDVFLPDGQGTDERHAFFAEGMPLLSSGCELPVIAVARGSARGLGWLLASVCDFMVCSEDGRYGYFAGCSMQEMQLLECRFPRRLAAALLAHPDGLGGREIASMLAGPTVVPQAEVDGRALELARQLAQAPRETLCLLKQHLDQAVASSARRLVDDHRNDDLRANVADRPQHADDAVWQDHLRQALDSVGVPDLGPATSIPLPTEAVTLQEYANGVAVVTMRDRHGKNTFTDALMQGVIAAFGAIATRPACKVVVLTGYDNYFSCGGTKDSLVAIQAGKVKFTDVPIYSLPMEASVPVIAAMQGHGIGAGWSLGMFCDCTIHSEKHTYVSPYIGYGFTPGAGSTLTFPEKFGLDLGREILFSAQQYTGSELRRRGAAVPVVPAEGVQPLALRLAAALATLPRDVLQKMKQDSVARLKARLPQALAQEQALHQRCFVGNQDVLDRIQSNFNEGFSMENQPSAHAGTDLRQDRALADALRDTLRELLAEELFMDASQIDGKQKFIDIGLDSITGVNWVRKINARYGLSINATKVYGYPTLEEFSQHVLDEASRSGLLEAGGSQATPPVAVQTPAPVAPAAAASPRMVESIRTQAVTPSVPAHSASVEPTPAEARQMVVGAATTQRDAPATATPVVTDAACIRNAVAEPHDGAAEALAPAPSMAASTDVLDRTLPKVAIIGMSGQFPKARDLGEFWDNLAAGRDCISEVPADRWEARQYYDADPDVPGKTYSKWMGVLEDAACFDPLFFNISPREAEWMDPQQRVFLQTAWHCIEDAGYSSATLSGSNCGVFVGCSPGDYSQAIRREDLNAQNFMGKAISILAAKIAYIMDLQGPCLTIDTACSSSLVAISAACDSLAMGSSDLALAGGVCVLAGPDMHIMTSKAGMLSADGRCYSFDQRANGFVPGEGVGALLLKRLDDAVRDGDHIHGVVGGWGVNQDGKTNGITAPNPKSQTRLMQDVHRKFGIDPSSIQVIEAHGTGTKLGDPIEIEGLKDAFGNSAAGQCLIGSVKSNIGHLLAAAGVAGTIKLLLSIKHRQIPPSVHFERINEHIELAGSPFRVNATCAEWQAGAGQVRRAAISSFGFSGTNAHLVIEEHADSGMAREPERHGIPHAVVLSARNPSRLQEAAQRLLDALSREARAGIRLSDVAYTLQVGREAMEERLAIEAMSIPDLCEKLSAFIRGERSPRIHVGQLRRGDETIALFTGSADLEETVRKWAGSDQLGKLLALWVKGLPFDWSRLYDTASDRPRRCSLPGYPFERKHYWLANAGGSFIQEASAQPAQATARQDIVPTLRPSLHAQASETAGEHLYSYRFTGNEFFFSQHLIMGRKVLPGVGHLEMVRAAVKEACGIHADAGHLQIQNVVWMRPIAYDDSIEDNVFHISLVVEGEGEMGFRIFSGDIDGRNLAIHSQGTVVLQNHAPTIPKLDIEHLITQCNLGEVDAHHHWEAMKLRGADLGPCFRGIDRYYLAGDDAGVSMVLAHIAIPVELTGAADCFVLHPTCMDAAVHTAPPLMPGWEDTSRTPLALPFALEELEVLGSCQEEMWAIARPAQGSRGNAYKYDIDLCDDIGIVCVRFKGFAFRTIDPDASGGDASGKRPDQRRAGGMPAAGAEAVAPSSAANTLLLGPAWRPVAHSAQPIRAFDRRIVALCDWTGDDSAIAARLPGVEVVRIAGAAGATEDERFRYVAREAFSLIQSVMKAEGAAGSARTQLQLIVPPGTMSGLSGMIRTLSIESRKLVGQVVELDSGTAAIDGNPDHVVRQIEDASRYPHEPLIRHRSGRCEALHWVETPERAETAALPWKERSVYLVTGGLGALGMVFAREIVSQVETVTLVLTGRTPLDDAMRARIEMLKASALRPGTVHIEYERVDVAQAPQVDALFRAIVARHGRLDGILHAAGIVRDNFIATKTIEELEQTLAPKVAGTMHLHRASQGLDLDFLILFSSIASGLGNAGQADYAMANGFLDAFARTASSDARSPRRVLSINWPLWQEGGMSIDEQTEQWMRDNTGMVPMRTTTGIDAFYRALAMDQPQLMALEGDVEAIRQWIFADSPPTPAEESHHPTLIMEREDMSQEQRQAADSPGRFDAVLGELRPVVADILKIGRHEIDLDKELINYGFDSITLTELTNSLNKKYRIPSRQALNPTVFFEHPTLRSFTGYLAAEYPQIGAAVASVPAQAPVQVPARTATAADALVRAPALAAADAAPSANQARAPQARMAAPLPSVSSSRPRPQEREPIAVVGMSGRFPMARNVGEFWSNLVQGRDCISEVPADRWDWREIYGDPAREVNKTDVKWGGFIEGVAEFDPFFFGLSPREALYIDPMQRLLMIEMWHAIEDAGYSAKDLSGTRTSIFVGTSVSEYGTLLAQAGVPCDAFLPTGRSASLGPNRMSYLLNITGASETVDTACSSSLVAIHRAVIGMETGQCDMALVGGANVLIAPDGHISFRKAGMLSQDGRCKTFSKHADGYARGEGAGILFLKRLSDAERDGDHIYGLVRSTGENHGGRAPSLTAPNPKAQADLIHEVYSRAGIDPRTIGYVEAHGTGTGLGDPVEVNGLKMAFKELYKATGSTEVASAHCGIGSAKSNIGHLEIGAGVAGAIKVLLQLKHKTLAKSLHCEEVNPYIQLQGSPFYVVDRTQPWPAPLDPQGRELPRRAGVSSFGFGGANAHVLFEEYCGPAQENVDAHAIEEGREHLFVLSARNEKRLDEAVEQLLHALVNEKTLDAHAASERYTDRDLARIAYTLQVGREAFDERLGVKASSLAELVDKLKRHLAGEEVDGLHRGKASRNDPALMPFDDDDLSGTIAKWIAKGQSAKLLTLWVKGYHVDWRMLHAGGRTPRRISLPGYPFARERHWPAGRPSTLSGTVARTEAVPAPATTRTFALLTKGWEPVASLPSCERIVGDQVVVLATADTLPLAMRLVERLGNAQVVNLSDEVAAGTYLSGLRQRDVANTGCIDLAGCSAQPPSSSTWIGILQALLAKQASREVAPMLLGVSLGLEALDNASPRLAGATRAGLFRMLQSEYTKVRSRHLDLDEADDQATQVEQILAEWTSRDPHVEVCYRKGRRHAAGLREAALPESTPPLSFAQDHVLWITGGTRGIGLRCAEHFVAHHGVRKLVLSGRDAVPPREQWAGILAEGRSPAAAKIEAIQRLEAQGVQVETLALPLSDSQAMQSALRQVTARLGRIGGVLHCAGLNDWDNPAFVRKPMSEFDKVLEPKVAGLDVLLDVLRSEPVQFIALFSSVSSVIPSLGVGQSSYVMANAYMDYAAQAHAARCPIVSIQWPSWKEAGMGEATTKSYRQTGLLSHGNEEGLQLLDRVLANRLGPVVLPAVVDRTILKPDRLMHLSLEERAPAEPVTARAPLAAATTVSVSSAATPLHTAVPGQLLSAAQAWLATLFGTELMVAPESLDADTPFQDYGVDSIMLTQLLRRVDDALRENGKTESLDPSVFFEYPTLSTFSSWLARTHPAPLAKLLDAGQAEPVPLAIEPTTHRIADPAPVAEARGEPQAILPPPVMPTLPATTAKAASTDGRTQGGIAVVGMSCRFPGAQDIDAFWTLLSEGRSAIRPVPASRWGQGPSRHAGLLDNVTDFDPGHFLIRQEDAEAMDPQAFLLLEESLAVLHHAGYTTKEMKGRSTGVYVGARSHHRPSPDALAQARNPIVAVGPNYLAANISQFFDLRGPSLMIDTACSSALVGMQMAVQALQAGDIESAIVGGVCVLPEEAYALFAQRNLLSESAEFHVLDRRAQGLVLGEGIAMVMLKTVEQALRDGDTIHAVIKGIATNNDGRTAGPATPNLLAQKAVMQQALDRSGHRPQDVRYIHVNGSGSEVTDLLELKALEAVYRTAADAGVPCELGSMEPNIGHPLCAKGIAAFLQVVLMLSRRRSVPFLSGQEPMTHYDIDASPFHFGRAASPWASSQHLAAINCFADGGTNAHVILQAWEAPAGSHGTRKPVPMPTLNRRSVRHKQQPKAAAAMGGWPVVAHDSGTMLMSVDHPVLRNHKAYDQELLPGLAYIDIIYQCFQRKGMDFRELELRNLSIYQPLIVAVDCDVLLDIQCVEDATGHWQVVLEGRERRGGELSAPKRYAVAEMQRIAPVSFDDTLDIDAVRRMATAIHELDALYDQCSQQGLSHSGIIKARGQVLETASETCIDISVRPELSDGADGFLFHPTLIDGSSVGTQRLFAAIFDGEKRLILPLFYESFRACAPLHSQCVTRVPLSSVRRKNELLYVNLEFFDSDGRKVAELLNYACKLVRDEGAINPKHRQSAEPAAQPSRPARAVAARPQVQEAVAQVSAETGDDSPTERFLIELMADKIGIAAEEIDTGLGYYELGLDSARLLDLVGVLQTKVGATLSPTLLFEYTNIAELAGYLAQRYPDAWRDGIAAAVAGSSAAAGQDVASGAKIAVMPARTAAHGIPGAEPALSNDDIAIIGMAGRYPGADNLAEFWRNLETGRDCITEVPASRWESARLEDVKSPSGKAMSRWGGFVSDPDRFDAQFFRVSPWEAKLLDPQQRMFLEVCWEAIEDAGYTPRTLVPPRGRNQRRNVGVYVGVMHNDYAILTADTIAQGQRVPVSLNYAQIANRVSYFCNFHGPSMAIDTVCSSSLIAVHQAIQSLRAGESEVALAGGVNLSLHPVKYLTYGLMDMHSSDGRCRTFGNNGDGYVSGEGIGAVVLKPLSRAIADNDHVYALIKGSTTNHVGTVSGLTVPSPVAQADMIEACLEKTGIHPRTISYVEAHGTGTSLGDPIEIQGLVKAFGHYTQDKQYCAIGSVKSNIGHAESAAGISGLTKVALQLHHKTLVPSLHSNELNPHLDFANSPFFVQHATQPWPQPVVEEGGRMVAYPRRAALSSFGASGSNAHLILEEYSASERRASLPAAAMPPVVVPLSAKKPDRLNAYAARLHDALCANPGIDLRDLAYTLQVGRESFDERVAFVASSVSELAARVQAFLSGAPQAPDSGWFSATVQKGRKPAPPALDDAETVAAAWVQDATPDWLAIDRNLFADAGPARRISVPTYPFARDRFWLDAAKNVPAAAVPSVPVTATAPSLVAPATPAAPVAMEPPTRDMVYFAPRWQPNPLPATAGAARPLKTTVFVVSGDAGVVEWIQRRHPDIDVMQLAVGHDIAHNLAQCVVQLLQFCKDPQRIRQSEPQSLLVYAPHHGTDYPYRALMGALRTISLELPFITTRLVLDAALAANDLERVDLHLRAEIAAQHGPTEIAYPLHREREALVQQVLAPAVPASLAGLIRQQGVYVITGGLGGLGLLFAEEIARDTGARIVLTGRSVLDAARQASLQALVDKGIRVEYLRCDTSRIEDVRRMVDEVTTRHGALHGVIHSAGMVSDNFIPKKSEAEVHDVLSAKVPAILNLDEATRHLPLDLFVAFSSAASLGNPGQLDYATANAFLDAFAGHRAEQVKRGERHGRTLSINWPLWRNGGMSVQPAYEKYMLDQYGITPMAAASGLRAFAVALATAEPQLGAFEGIRGRIESLLSGTKQVSAPTPTGIVRAQATKPSQAKASGTARARAVEQVVRDAIGEALGMEADTVDLKVEFPDYGMDSIGAVKVANHINQKLGLQYTGAVFMELSTGEKLLEHLIEQDVEPENAQHDEQAVATAPLASPAPVVALDAPTIADIDVKEQEIPAAAVSPPVASPASAGKAAIIGYDASLPGADDVESYWRNLLDKSIAIDEVLPSRWKQRGVALERMDGPYAAMRHAALLDRIDGFDASFWELSEDEAKEMDPQQRLLLQSIWHCVEQAGYSMKQLTQGKVGLFLALDSLDYQSISRRNAGAAKSPGLSVGLIANQISYLCNFKGPSEAIDNACASTYVAVKRAAQAIAAGECDTAIVGSAKILLDPAGFIGRDEGEILSRSGRMYPFDEKADGYVRGEGVGCVLLKGLDRAINDEDTVHAVVLGVGVSHNGRGGLSPIAPNVEGQCNAIRQAYQVAGIAPDTVRYIEAHGTSNSFSDASELAAFKQFFKESMDADAYRNHRCAVSTVKGNIGHLEGASGMASLIKALCAIRNETIAPIATWTKCHPSILLANSPFHFPTEPTAWPSDPQTARRVGLHSIGIGGVNAHLLLEAPARQPAPQSTGVREGQAGGHELVVISAKSKAALRASLAAWRHDLASSSSDETRTLANIAYTSRVGRDAMAHRVAFVVDSLQGLSRLLALELDQIEKHPVDSAEAYVGTAMVSNTPPGAATPVALAADRTLAGLKAIAQAWLSGSRIDWSGLASGKARRVQLPAYPFQMRRAWCVDEPTDDFATLFYETFGKQKATNMPAPLVEGA